jgi:hypothetical protein
MIPDKIGEVMAKTWIDEELKIDWWKRNSAKHLKLILDIYRMKMSD